MGGNGVQITIGPHDNTIEMDLRFDESNHVVHINYEIESILVNTYARNAYTSL